MKAGRLLLAFICLTVVAVDVASIVAETQTWIPQLESQTDRDRQWNGRVSWAIGICLPDDVPLAGGQSLDWSRISNVTTLIRLPNIRWTDGVIYAILSVMTSSATVLQVATGLYPGDEEWLGYVLYIKEVSTHPQRYFWVVNRSAPEMKPYDLIALSVYLDDRDGWMYKIENLESKMYSKGSMVKDGSMSFRRGEQEVFALEAYTSNPEAFKEMGSLVLESIFLNGDRVDAGWYLLGGWVPVHKPLFLVGGGSAPSFISVTQTADRKVAWSYSSQVWEGYQPDLGAVRIAYVLTLSAIVLLASMMLLNVNFRKKMWAPRRIASSYFLR